MKKIKDYLHLYLGCEVMNTFEPDGRSGKEKFILNIIDEGVLLLTEKGFIKPILRPLSDMTEEELQECGNLDYDFSDEPDLNNHKWQDFYFTTAEQCHWLLQHHFDLFSLIESGLAIDKTKLSNGQNPEECDATRMLNEPKAG